MAEIITRSTGDTAKGSPLTTAELDQNFINLNLHKVEKEAGKGLSDTNFTQDEKTKLAGWDAALAGKADKTTQVIAGTGLTGGGTLASNRTLSVSYGTAAGTAAQGDDSRLSNSREWTAATITQAEAEAGVAATRRAWTAQSVRQASNASITAQKGIANGIASLDANAKIPLSQLSDSIVGQVEYMGLWTASTNTPTLPTTPAQKGQYYVVNTAGTQFGHSFAVGDWIISNGASWDKVDNTDAVSTVNGRTGNITGLAESTDTRFTDSREWTAATITQAEAEAGTATTRRAFTALSVRQAIVAWWTSITGVFGRDLVTSADSTAARSKLGLFTSALRWPTFAEVTGKPATYAPSAHTHPVSQVTGLSDAATTSVAAIRAGTAGTANRAGTLNWTAYGGGQVVGDGSHVIFDASSGKSPSGSAVDNTNPADIWATTLPTLMGWSGIKTYGVRVDRARYAETLTSNITINGVAANVGSNITVADNTKLPLGGGTLTGSLSVTGDFVATGNITAYSDIKLKENIEVIPDALTKINTLHGYTYNRKDIEDGTRHTGVIAQEVQKVLPEAVMEDEDGTLSVAYGNMVGLLIEAIKELKAEVDELKGVK